jgi:hypothetical protein
MAYAVPTGVTCWQSWMKPVRGCVGVADDRAAEVDRLSRQLARVAKVLIDLGLLPLEDIPLLQEVLDFGASPWD